MSINFIYNCRRGPSIRIMVTIFSNLQLVVNPLMYLERWNTRACGSKMHTTVFCHSLIVGLMPPSLFTHSLTVINTVLNTLFLPFTRWAIACTLLRTTFLHNGSQQTLGPQNFEPVVSRYTDWATWPTFSINYVLIIIRKQHLLYDFIKENCV